jgi:hypothetical protein
MDLLYAFACETASAVTDVLLRLRVDVINGVLFDAEVVDFTPDHVAISRATAPCTVRIDGDRSLGLILIFGLRQDVNSVGLCWDTLILLSLLRPSDVVWLSTYPKSELADLGNLRPVVLHGTPGFVLSASQFDALVG